MLPPCSSLVLCCSALFCAVLRAHSGALNTDVLHYNDCDVDGNIGLSGIILPKTAFPDGENITNKRAATKTRAWVKMSSRIEPMTDPLRRDKWIQASNRGFTKIKAMRTRASMLRHWGTQTSSKRPPIVTGIKGARPHDL